MADASHRLGSASLASLIADTERLLASSTLGREVEGIHRESSSLRNHSFNEHDDDDRLDSSIDITVEYDDDGRVEQRVDIDNHQQPITINAGNDGHRPASALSIHISPSHHHRRHRSRSLSPSPSPSSLPQTQPQPRAPSPSPQAQSMTLNLTDLSPDAIQAWSELNRLLVKNGFTTVTPPVSSNPESLASLNQLSLVSTFQSVLTEFGKRGSLIQELITNTRTDSDSDSASSRVIEKQKHRISELHSELVKLQHEHDTSRAQWRHELTDREAELDALKARLIQSKAEVRAKESVIRSLQSELDAQIANTSQSSVFNDTVESAFRRLYGRDAVDGNDTDEQILRIIRLFESQLTDSRKEITFLRQSLNDATSVNRQHASAETQNIESLELLKSQYESTVTKLRSELRARDAHYAAQEKSLHHRAKEAEAEQQSLRRQYDDLDRLYRRTVSELEVKRDDPESDREIERLKSIIEKQCDKIHQLSQSQSVPLSVGAMDTMPINELHSVGSNRLAALLQKTCELLGLTDAMLLPATISDLATIIRAVPRMQRFIRQVCDVLVARAGSGDLSGVMPVALKTLKSWQAAKPTSTNTHTHTDSGSSNGSGSVVGRLAVELGRRKHKFHTAINATTNIDLLLTELSDLVDSENRLYTLMYGDNDLTHNEHLHNPLSPNYAHTNSVGDPARMLTHFQHLFDVPHVNGILPRMNEIYIFVNEQRAAMVQLRAMLGLTATCPTHTIVNAIGDRVAHTGTASDSVNVTDNVSNSVSNSEVRRSINALSHSHSSIINDRGDSLSLTDSVSKDLVFSELIDLLGVDSITEMPRIVNQLLTRNDQLAKSETKIREFSKILKRLKSVLDVEHVSELVAQARQLRDQTQSADYLEHTSTDAVKSSLLTLSELLNTTAEKLEPTVAKLVSRYQLYSDLMPSVDSLVTQLYVMLNVTEIADIVPAVEKLLDVQSRGIDVRIDAPSSMNARVKISPSHGRRHDSVRVSDEDSDEEMNGHGTRAGDSGDASDADGGSGSGSDR